MLRRLLLTALLACTLMAADAAVSKHTADSIANLLNQRELVCDKSCPLFESENSNAGLVNTIFIDVLVIIGTVWLYTNYKKKYFIGLGAAVVLIVSGSLYLRSNNKNKQQCIEYKQSNCKVVTTGQQTTKAVDANEFEQVDSSASTSSPTASNDEFSNMDTPAAPAPVASVSEKKADPHIVDPLIALGVIALISIGIRYRSFIRFRGLFLLAGVAWFGFYRGACDCMISSFQSLVLSICNWKFVWSSLVWIGSLVVATYFFGRIWCGWLCHLGGIQDFLFRSQKLKWATSAKSQKYLRITRYTIVGLWILQLVTMQQNLYCKYDPFKSLFNLIFTDWTSIGLLILLLIASVLIYRPFCRTICPVGVILEWISLLPGARKMRIKQDCVNCGMCSKECAMHAIRKTTGKSVIDTTNCIGCGECITSCRKGCIKNDTK